MLYDARGGAPRSRSPAVPRGTFAQSDIMATESSAFRFAHHSDTLTVNLGARLGMDNRQELKGGVLAALDEGARLVRVRFAAAQHPTFVDSSGWGVLVALTRRAQEAGARLVLVDVDPGNLEYLALTRLGDFFAREPGDQERMAA